MSGAQASGALDYEELEREVLARIAETRLVTLATSAGGRVTARTVSVVSDGPVIFFQSAESTTKNKQIAVNPNVALSDGALRLEGTARDVGRPLEHPFFTRAFAEAHADAFKQYSPRAVTRLFAVRPRLATLWKLDPDSGPHEVIVDLESRTARRNPLLSPKEWRALSAVGG